jgi:MFS family permease
VPDPAEQPVAVTDLKRPSPGATLAVHIFAVVLMQGTWQAAYFMMPVLARKRFDANPAEVLLITMAPMVLATLSIFWQVLLRRGSIRRYLLIYWAAAMLPTGLIALAQSYWHMLVFFLIGSLGSVAWSSVNGELLKRLYPDRQHGRAFAWLSVGTMLAGAVLSLGVGTWLSRNPDAFRWYLPVFAAVQLAGVLLLARLARAAGAERPGQVSGEPWSLSRTLEPLAHMREVLRADRVFFRYEAAFMTYGIGWMICWALLPLLVTDKLGLNYDAIAAATAFATQIATLLAIVPAGRLNDRLGPTRTSAVAFAVYTLYPLGLVFAQDATQLTIASVVFGIAAAGANMGWLLGPVSLAPSPDKVPQYVAIHATLVGVRGTVFQGLGVGLYAATGSFTPALLIAAGGFAWAAWQMAALHRTMEQARRAEQTGDPAEYRGAEQAK